MSIIHSEENNGSNNVTDGSNGGRVLSEHALSPHPGPIPAGEGEVRNDPDFGAASASSADLDAVGQKQDSSRAMECRDVAEPGRERPKRVTAGLGDSDGAEPADRQMRGNAGRSATSATLAEENPLELVDAEPWEETVNGAELLNSLETLVKRFVVLPEHAAAAIALWVVHTYAFKLREISTYLGLESPEKRCGKTTLLSVLTEVVRRPVVAANISSPAFFRVIQQTEPTLLIDEADTFLQGNDELRGILNSGYTRKTAFVVRVTNQFSDEGYRKFSCWCPKVVASIGRLPETLADRCIVIRMQRKTRHEQCERVRGFDGMEYRRKCVRWVNENAMNIKLARPEWPASLNDRAADIWEPLLALADLAGGEWPDKARRSAEFLTRRSSESNPMASLLLDLFIIFAGSGKDRLFTRDVVDRLNACQARPWSESRKGKPVNDAWLAQQLRPYGVKSQNLRIEGMQAKGFLMNDMMEVFKRYLPKGDVEAFLAETPDAVEKPKA